MNENFKKSTIEKEAERFRNLQDIDLDKIENELSFSESTDNNVLDDVNFNEWRKIEDWSLKKVVGTFLEEEQKF